MGVPDVDFNENIICIITLILDVIQHFFVQVCTVLLLVDIAMAEVPALFQKVAEDVRIHGIWRVLPMQDKSWFVPSLSRNR